MPHIEDVETRLSESKLGLGIVRSRMRRSNPCGEAVISFEAAALVRRRPQ